MQPEGISTERGRRCSWSPGPRIAIVSIPLAAAAGPPYLSFASLSPWLVTYAIGLFAALFATPFLIHSRLGGELEADARWERALLWWGAVALGVLGASVILRPAVRLRHRLAGRRARASSGSPRRCSCSPRWSSGCCRLTRRAERAADPSRLTGQSVGLHAGGQRRGPESMRAAAIQLNSTADKARNLERAGELVRRGRRGRRRADRAAGEVEPARRPGRASSPAPSRSTARRSTAARGWARELGVAPGRRQHRRAVGGRASASFNTSCLIDPDGEIVAAYRKIHMFDVDVGGVSYRESDAEQPGEEIVTADVGGVEVGLTVCYDLRFPELYRILAVARRPRPHGALGVHARRPGATTGRCCCARGRSRTRRSWSPPTRSARRRRTTTPTGTR